LKLMLLLR